MCTCWCWDSRTSSGSDVLVAVPECAPKPVYPPQSLNYRAGDFAVKTSGSPASCFAVDLQLEVIVCSFPEWARTEVKGKWRLQEGIRQPSPGAEFLLHRGSPVANVKS